MSEFGWVGGWVSESIGCLESVDHLTTHDTGTDGCPPIAHADCLIPMRIRRRRAKRANPAQPKAPTYVVVVRAAASVK